jgi:hypothetical protein
VRDGVRRSVAGERRKQEKEQKRKEKNKRKKGRWVANKRAKKAAGSAGLAPVPAQAPAPNPAPNPAPTPDPAACSQRELAELAARVDDLILKMDEKVEESYARGVASEREKQERV